MDWVSKKAGRGQTGFFGFFIYQVNQYLLSVSPSVVITDLDERVDFVKMWFGCH